MTRLQIQSSVKVMPRPRSPYATWGIVLFVLSLFVAIGMLWAVGK